MKKISVLSVLSVIAFPVMAEEIVNASSDVIANESQIATVDSEPVNAVVEPLPIIDETKFNTKTTNPKAKFPHGLQLGLGISPTSGLNGFVGYNNKNFDSFWAKRFGIRFDFATYSPIKSRMNKEINNIVGDDGFKVNDNIKLEDFELNAEHYGAVIDFYPFGDTWFLGGWRISGGYMTGKLDLIAAPYSDLKDGKIDFVLNDYSFSYLGDKMLARAKANWKYSGPYLGTGFDLGILKGFKLFMDAGVIFANNTPDIELDVPLDNLYRFGNPVVPGTPEYDIFEAAYNGALADARHEVKDFKYFPLVKVGFMYRF